MYWVEDSIKGEREERFFEVEPIKEDEPSEKQGSERERERERGGSGCQLTR